ncbi:MAG: energy transducer TonB [Nitrospinales bacterium]
MPEKIIPPTDKSLIISVKQVKLIPNPLASKVTIAQRMFEKEVPSRRIKTSFSVPLESTRPFSLKSSFPTPTPPAHLKTAHVLPSENTVRPITGVTNKIFQSPPKIEIVQANRLADNPPMLTAMNVSPLSKTEYFRASLFSEQSIPKVESKIYNSNSSWASLNAKPLMKKNLLNEITADPKITQVVFRPSQNNRTNGNTPQKPNIELQNPFTTPGQPVSPAGQTAPVPHDLKSDSFQVPVLHPTHIDSPNETSLNSGKNYENYMNSVQGSLKVEVKEAGWAARNFRRNQSAALTPVHFENSEELLNSGERLQKIREGFTSQVREKIAMNKRYPKIARKRGFEGKPMVTFTLAKNGTLLEIKIEQPSPHSILDKGAIQTVKNAAPYPPIPEQLHLESMQFKLPISYVLK